MIKNFSIALSLLLILIPLLDNSVLLVAAELTGDLAIHQGSRSILPPHLHGVNFLGYNTTLTESRDNHKSIPNDYYNQSFKIISEAGLNIIRYLFTWESYEKSPSLFMDEIKRVAEYADKWRLNVIYTNNQFHISSWLNPSGYGFPHLLFRHNEDMPYGGGGASDNETAKLWWTNWYNRSISDVNGNDGWTLQAEYLKKIVNTVDNHKSTLGYEILNEPQVYSVDQWKKIGNYNTFITNELRKLTSKIIVFDRQLPSDIGGPINALPSTMAEMAPSNSTNVVFKSTLFGLPTHCSFAEARLNTASKTAQLIGIPLWMGEFNIGITPRHPFADLNQSEVNLFISKFGEVDAWGWSFWMWSFREHPLNVKNYDLVNVTEHEVKTTKYFEYLKNASSDYGYHGNFDVIGNEKQMVVGTKDSKPLDKMHSSGQLSPKDTICPTAPVVKINGTRPGTDYSKSTSYDPIEIYVKSLPAKVLIEGEAYDSGSGLKMVEIRLRDTSYQNVTLDSEGDWSRWSHIIPITKGSVENELIIRARDNADNVKHHTLFISFVKS